MMRAALSIIVATSLILSGASRASADVVERRGGASDIDGEVNRIDDNGVMVRDKAGVDQVVPWDRVRRVTLNRNEPALENYREDADNLWRARSRLDRGDTALAEPLFERLFEKYRGRSHETALVVAEGLLRCQLARGANDTALIPALEVARLRLANVTTSVYADAGLPPVMDEKTALCPMLAPVWASSLGMVKLEHDLASYDPNSNPVVVSLRSLYRRAVRIQLNMDLGAEEKVPAADHPGVKLLQTLVAVLSKDASQRELARQRMQQDLGTMPAWAQAWAHYVMGVSLLGESGVGRQQTGLVSLVHLPASFADTQPFLAGMALAKLADACDANGDSATAVALRTELQSRYPNHPILASMMNRAPATSTTRPKPVAATKPGKEPS